MIKLLNSIINICLTVIIILISTFSIPKLFGFTPCIITHDNMEPVFSTGGLTYVTKIEPENVVPGDVIVFNVAGSKNVAIYQVNENDTTNYLFSIQSTNQNQQDGVLQSVSYEALIGKATICIPYLGDINQFCTTAPGSYVLISTIGALICLSIGIEKLSNADSSKEKIIYKKLLTNRNEYDTM